MAWGSDTAVTQLIINIHHTAEMTPKPDHGEELYKAHSSRKRWDVRSPQMKYSQCWMHRIA